MFAKKSKLQELVDTATPYVEDARDRIMNDVLPAVQQVAQDAADTAREQAGPAAAEAKRRSLAATAALKGEEPVKKGGKLKKLLVLAGLAGVAAFAAKKLGGGSDEQAWQSSYTPKHTQPTPTPTPAPTADDAAGSTPGEALADSQDEPHAASTPDAPVEVSEIDAQPDPDRL